VDTLLDLGLRNALGATLLAVLAAGIGCVCRRPALVHCLWLLVLLRLLVPPLLLVQVLPRPTAPRPAILPETTPPTELPALPVEEPDFTPTRAAETAVVLEAAAPAASPDWKPVVLALWLAGSLLWWLLAGVRLARFGRLLSHAQPAPASVQDQAQRLAVQLGLARCPGVWLVPAPVSPMLWALGAAPRLLLPVALWERLGPEQQDTLLTHELAHLRRRDHWVRRLELLVLGLYWWHPVVWWARRQLREAEEQCCDAWVVWALPSAARAYATALLETVTFLSQSRPALPAMASGAGHVRLLKRRLTMILRGTPSRTLTSGGLLAVLALAALLLPLWPTWAEQPASEPVAEKTSPDPNQAPGDPARPADPVRDADRKLRTADALLNDLLPKATPGPSGIAGDQRADLRDEIELLEAQLDVKKAEVQAAVAELGQARERLDHLKTLVAKGYASTGMVTSAQAEVNKLESQVLVKRAELKEPEVRLKQAKRRLEQLQHGQEPAAAPLRPASWAEGLFKERIQDLGQVWQDRSTRYKAHFPLKNSTKECINLSGLRISSSGATATASLKGPVLTTTNGTPPCNLPPGQEGEIEVSVDARRFLGSKTIQVHVQFDRPAPAEVVLAVRLESRARAESPPTRPADTEKRLRELERRLDEFLKEMDALKKELRPREPDGQGAATMSPPLSIDRKQFAIPIQLDPAQAGNVREVQLYSSTDAGETWKQVATQSPPVGAFVFNAPNDGDYWFSVCVVDRDGKRTPEDVRGQAPGLKVRVNTRH
jgi:beta-lactamase regulating signal transducer with metallopeptidase domain